MGRQAITNYFAVAGRLAGIGPSLAAYDMRRGSMKDVIRMSGGHKERASFNTASHLGHSRESFSKGVSEIYTESVRQEIFQQRLESHIEDPFDRL